MHQLELATVDCLQTGSPALFFYGYVTARICIPAGYFQAVRVRAGFASDSARQLYIARFPKPPSWNPDCPDFGDWLPMWGIRVREEHESFVPYRRGYSTGICAAADVAPTLHTSNCIVTGEPARQWTGHVVDRTGQVIIAGFARQGLAEGCTTHEGEPCGCLGPWRREYGVRFWPLHEYTSTAVPQVTAAVGLQDRTRVIEL